MKTNYMENPWSLKIDLMLRGTRIEDPLVKAWACGTGGIDMLLPQDTLVNIPCREEFTRNSPYLIKKKGDGYVITDGENEAEVRLLDKPAYYNKRTSSGRPMSAIAVSHGSYTVITPNPKCGLFGKSVECRYCSGNFDVAGDDSAVYSVEDVVETVEAVLGEKDTEIIYLSIGFGDTDDGGIVFLKPYIQEIKRRFNCLVAVEAVPPKDNRWIDETYAVGADSVLYNLDIYDKELFEVICAGRASLVGRKRYLEALEYAAGIFPNGTVASHLIVGLEPPGSTCMGIDHLTGMGVMPILPIYRPAAGKALRIEPLNAEIIIPVFKHLHMAIKNAKINTHWVRGISMVTTPVEARMLADGADSSSSMAESFYKTRLGKKAAWGLSTLRRRLRVRDADGEPGSEH